MINSFNDLASDVSLMTILKALEFEIFSTFNCMRIGRIDEIISVNEVRCSITNKRLMQTNEDGSSEWRDYPPIFARIYYMGSALNNITYPLTINTPCLLLFNDREFDSYFKTGEVSTLSDLRMHSLSDCICIPLFTPTVLNNLAINGDIVNLTATTAINLTAATVNIDATTININGELIINGQKYLEHTHSNGNMGSPTGGVITS